MKARKPINRISKKKLSKLGGKLPYSTIIGKAKAVNKVSNKQKKRLAALKVIRDRWWSEGKRTCGICRRFIMERDEYTLDHIIPGHGKSDHESNLQPAHWLCNSLKGSRRNFSLD